MNRELIARYRSGASELWPAITGLSHEELISEPVPGTWSIQQIVMHLMDSDLIASDRMKRIIAEENPTLLGFNESKFASRLFYNALDPVAACELFRLNRLLTASILDRLADEAFDRQGTHNEAGRLTLANLVATYVDHLAHHLKFIYRKRRLIEARG